MDYNGNKVMRYRKMKFVKEGCGEMKVWKFLSIIQ